MSGEIHFSREVLISELSSKDVVLLRLKKKCRVTDTYLMTNTLYFATNTVRAHFNHSAVSKLGCNHFAPLTGQNKEKKIKMLLKFCLWSGKKGSHHYGCEKAKGSKHNPSSSALRTGTEEAA